MRLPGRARPARAYSARSRGLNTSPRRARPIRSTARAVSTSRAALAAVGGQHRVDPVRGEGPAQFGPGAAVSLAGSLHARRHVVTGHGGQRDRMAPQHPVQPVVGWHHVEQPGHRGDLEVGTAWRVHPRRPARRNVGCHATTIANNRTPVQSGIPMAAPSGLAATWVKLTRSGLLGSGWQGSWLRTAFRVRRTLPCVHARPAAALLPVPRVRLAPPAHISRGAFAQTGQITRHNARRA